MVKGLVRALRYNVKRRTPTQYRSDWPFPLSCDATGDLVQNVLPPKPLPISRKRLTKAIK